MIACPPTLTRRESEVVRLVGQGWRSDEIASKLCISRKTVEAHIAHIARKFEHPNIYALRRAATEMYIQREVERRLALTDGRGRSNL